MRKVLYLTVETAFDTVVLCECAIYGELAKLGSRLTGSQEARGSNPLFSTKLEPLETAVLFYSQRISAFFAELNLQPIDRFLP